MARVADRGLKQIEQSLEELRAHVVALTAVVGGVVIGAAIELEILEDSVNFAAERLRVGARPILLAKASAVLEDIEALQKVLRVETRKKRREDQTLGSRARNKATVARSR